MFRELCGDSTLRNVILVTNMWGEVTRDVGEARERELTTNFFQQVINKGAQYTRHQNTPQSAYDIIRRVMKNQPIVLQIQRELVDEHKVIMNTAAGDAVSKDIKEQIKRYQAEMKVVQEEMMQALKDKDEETRKELEEEARRLQDQMDRMKKELGGMAPNYQEDNRRMEEAMREMSSSSFGFDPPRDGVTSVHHHPKYYMDTDMVIFKVSGYLGMVASNTDHPLLATV